MRSPLLLGALLFSAALATAPLAKAESAVALRVEANVKSEMGKSSNIGRTQHRGLTIYLSNNSPELLNLKVKYVIFGRSAVHHDVITVGQGENPVQIKAMSNEKVDITPVTSTATETHYDVKAKKKVDATGASIIGQGVQVWLGDKVVAEYYEPLSLKEEFAKISPVTKPSAAPAAPAKAANPAK